MTTTSQIDHTIFGLLDQRAAGKTICPSEVARALSPNAWRNLMDDVRQAAFRLADRHKVDITQGGHAINGRTAKGPIRLRRHEK